MFPLYITESLKLDLLSEKYTRTIFDLTEDNRTFLREWLPWVDYTILERDTLEFIQYAMRQFHNNKGVQTVILYRGQVVGMIGVNEIQAANLRAEIGYWLAEGFQGLGLMTRSCERMLQYCFEELHLHRVSIRCAPGNDRSKAIPERLHFVKEGIIRQCEYVNDQYVDHIVYGLLKQEYKTKFKVV